MVFPFSQASAAEREVLVGAFKRAEFEEGTAIIHEGDSLVDDGGMFFMIESGEVKCTRGEGDQDVEVNKRLGRGDVFGEVALLRDEPRQATVTAVTDTSCWTVDRETFKRVLGDLEELTFVFASSSGCVCCFDKQSRRR